MATKEQVTTIFNDIAPNYDSLNHVLSLNIDRFWRKRAILNLSDCKGGMLLDVACGTGDFSIQAATTINVQQVVGIDISENMLKIGREKLRKKGLKNKVKLRYGDGEHIEYEDNTFDAVTVAFGVRNFEHLETGLKEMNRVLKEGGKVVILEFSTPKLFPLKQLYRFYFKHILPRIGGLMSGNNSAYTYLPESVYKFTQGKKFLKLMTECGFKHVRQRKLTFGVASIYSGYK
ncbi:MAG: bifunctional demethylmenaquinone methyltransferase/2-methoxy-6-polyprenyl-1,4-benzoquinol methylase UbiE [Prevotellaceae bacterium]|jgi:demethylmenaquinone methyltransferase/2-methoxy-6-polyprenyl-1,4-benzoquinol methylase|nr:bifunctional demethylmenaquinone methyltransferase/2-methoxy-6-polyprenyl-1,4-benzoquinol methylase UbiE [Prevotellaceae bacterium]